MSRTLIVTSANARRSAVGPGNHIDVDVTVDIPGLDLLHGEVTLTRRPSDRALVRAGRWSWQWVSHDLLRQLEHLCDRDFTACLDSIEASAVDAVEDSHA